MSVRRGVVILVLVVSALLSVVLSTLKVPSSFWVMPSAAKLLKPLLTEVASMVA